MNEPGTLAGGENGDLRIEAGGGPSRIGAREVRSPLGSWRVVPITRVLQNPSPERGVRTGVIAIEGYAAITRSGKAVLLSTGTGHCIVPVVSFPRVARGGAVPAPLFPLVPDLQDGPA